MDLGPHAIFIWAAYGACLLVLVSLAVWLWLDGRRHQHTLAELESRGVRRRSSVDRAP